MRVARKIQKLIKDIPINTNADTDEMVLGDMFKALEQSRKKKAAATQPLIWRRIMRSRITRLTTAAVVVVAVMIAIHLLGGPPDGSSVVWADVLNNMEEMRTCKHRETRVLRFVGKEKPFVEADIVKYVSTEHGVREDWFKDGKLICRIYMLIAEQEQITVFPLVKKYRRDPLTKLNLWVLKHASPKGIVELFRSGEYKELGRRTIDGVEVEGIETRDTSVFSYGPVEFESFVLRLWVDVETSLPVRSEGELLTSGKSALTLFKPLEIKGVADNVEWNAVLDASVFEPDIPPDYTLIEE